MNLEQEQDFSGAPETEDAAPEQISRGTETTPTQQDLLDLDKVERFRFQGKELTPKELANSYLMHSDYTKKTQEIAQERKYIDNLNFDLNKVKNNPALAQEFLRVYPKKYHEYLRYVVDGQQSQPQESAQRQSTQQASGLPDEFVKRFESVEQKLLQREADAISAELDNKFQSLSKKYPYADEEAVVARAQALHNQGTELTSEIWDKLFQMRHDQVKALVDSQRKQDINKQRDLNQKGKDVASGGGIPTQAPKRPKTIREASRLALQELEAQ